jgi:hypothetical protein
MAARYVLAAIVSFVAAVWSAPLTANKKEPDFYCLPTTRSIAAVL